MATLNSNASANISASTFFSELMHISTDIVWKNQSLANNCERSDSYIEVEMFMAAKKGILTFDSIYQFDYQTLIIAGLNDEQAQAGVDIKSSIPDAYRALCTAKYISRLLEINPETGKYIRYEETNDYYRMLYGLPNYEDTDYVYNTIYSDVSKTTPVHELSIQDRYLLESRGYITKLIEDNPDKEYLKHLTDKCIDPYVSRSAERYSILWMNTSDYHNLISDFRDVYNDCRYNIIKVYYTQAFKRDSSHYEGFMAMCVLFMTIQLMHYKYLDVDITRDFYDLDSIKYIYDSYSVPFFSSIPLQYHTKIVKNINRLLSYKGSTRVFFDLFDIFDYGGMDVYEYYLLKTHKFENGAPIFTKLPDGSYDYRQMYDIKFAKVRLYDNPPMEISDPENHISYETMTTLDPYWVSDEELLNKLYSEKFNYLETKYVGIQTLFDMTKIMYESSYFFKMLLDNKTAVSNLSIYISTIPKYVDLFILVIYICALVCAKYGFKGDISNSLPVVSKILGFDFKQDLSIIRADILADPNLRNDTTLLSLINSMNINSLSSINTVFGKITNLRHLLTTRKCESKTREKFYAYYNLERTLMTTSFVESVYKKSDGTIAESFSDLLLSLDSELYVRLTSEELNVTYELDVILASLSRQFSNLEYIEFSDGNDISSIIEHLFKILNFFKSAKSELTGYNIVYTMSSRGANMLKFLDEMHMGINNISHDDTFKYLTDYLQKYYAIYKNMSELQLSLNSDKLISKTNRKLVESQIQTLQDALTVLGIKIYSDAEDTNINLDDIIKISSFKTILKSHVSFIDINTLIYEKIDYEGHSTIIKETFEAISDMLNRSIDIQKIRDIDLTVMKDEVVNCVEIVISKLGNKINDKILAGDYQKIYEKNSIKNDGLNKLIDTIFNISIKESLYGDITINDTLNYIYKLMKISTGNQIPLSDNVESYTNYNLYDAIRKLVDGIVNSIITYSRDELMNMEDLTNNINLLYKNSISNIFTVDKMQGISIPVFKMEKSFTFSELLKRQMFNYVYEEFGSIDDLLNLTIINYYMIENLTATDKNEFGHVLLKNNTEDIISSLIDGVIHPLTERVLPESYLSSMSDTIYKIIAVTVLLTDASPTRLTDAIALMVFNTKKNEALHVSDSLTLISERVITI